MKKKQIKKESLQSRVKKANQYVKDNLLKQVLKQKLYELGIIPTVFSIIYFIPYWFGLLVVKVIGYDNLSFFRLEDVFSRGEIWALGIIPLMLLVFLIWINIVMAKFNLEKKARDKFDVDSYELHGGGYL